jgi:hypothetical protein
VKKKARKKAKKIMVKNRDFSKIETMHFDRLEEIDDFIETAIDVNTFNESKHSREWWSIAAYVYFHSKTGNLSLPLNLRREKQPKPDFWILGSSSEEVGIETTFCCEEKYEQAKSICKARNDGSYPINTSFMKDEIKQFDESCLQLPNQPLHGMPIYGNYSTEYTIDRIVKSINIKTEKYGELRSCFRLIVYVNLPSREYVEATNSRAYICRVLSTHTEWFNTFNSIEILWSKDDVRAI